MESDISEMVAPRTSVVGDVPLEWYEDEQHIGHDITGKKIKKKEREDKLQSHLTSTDDPNYWRRITDERNDEEVELTREEFEILREDLTGDSESLVDSEAGESGLSEEEGNAEASNNGGFDHDPREDGGESSDEQDGVGRRTLLKMRWLLERLSEMLPWNFRTTRSNVTRQEAIGQNLMDPR